MGDAVARADKLVKIGLAMVKLVGGDARVEAVGEIMKVVTNGRDLLADLRPEERDIGRRLRAACEAQLVRLDGNPEYPPKKLRDSRAHMDEALAYCIPGEATLVGLDLDPVRITEAMIAAAKARAPRADFAVTWKRDGSHSLHYFRAVCVGFFGDLLKDEALIQQLLPVLWGDLLKTVHGIDEITRRTEAKVDGVTEEVAKLRAELLAQAGGGRAEMLEAQIAELRDRHAEDDKKVANLLRILLDRHVAPDQWRARIEEAEVNARKLLSKDYRLPNEASEAERELIGEARRALERFDFARAEELRREVRELGRKRRRDAQEMMAAQDAAETAEIAATVAASLDYRRAAELYREAGEAPYLAKLLQRKFHALEAMSLYELGRIFGDNNALSEAICILRDVVIPLASLNQVPDEWAGALNDLGLALKTLGEREGDVSKLEASVIAHEDSLRVWTLADTPSRWIKAQINIGDALLTLGGGCKKIAKPSERR